MCKLTYHLTELQVLPEKAAIGVLSKHADVTQSSSHPYRNKMVIEGNEGSFLWPF